MTSRLALPVTLAALLAACAGDAPPTLDQMFPTPPRPESHYYSIEGHRIHYMQMDGPAERRILFIHGTPGEWAGWAHYLADSSLQKRATMIAVDRPGFGESEPGKTVPAIEDQARLLEPLLHEAADPAGKVVPTLVVGHSLGGPIAAALAMDYPQEVRGAVLVAPSIDPATEGPRWYNEAMTWWLVRKLAPDDLGWSNRELMPLVPELKVMEPRWKSLAMPITIIQGEKDELVDPRTADYAERMLPHGNTVIRVPDEGHFVLWEKPGVVVQAIAALLDGSSVAAAHPGSLP